MFYERYGELNVKKPQESFNNLYNAKNNQESFNKLYEKSKKLKKRKKLKIMVITIIVMLSLIILSFLPYIIDKIKILNLSKQFKKDIQTNIVEKYNLCNEIKIEGQYNNILTVYMDNNMDNLEYEEKEKIIKEISSKANSKFEQYINNMDKRKNLIKSTCNISVYINQNCYKYDINKEVIKKNDKDYSLKIYLKEFILEKIKDNSYDVFLDNIEDEKELKNISSMTDIKKCKNEILYLSALEAYNNDDFKKAIEEFNLISGNYKDKKKYLENSKLYKKLQGTWYGTATVKSVGITGLNIIMMLVTNGL